jgi:hypothetical protein
MSIDAMKQALEALEMLAKWEHPASNITTKTGRIYPHHVALNAANNLRQAIEQAERQQDDLAYREAVSLAKAIFKKHFAHEEHYASGRIVWEPLDTTAGVISQIDNMTCQLVAPPQRQPLTDEEIAVIDDDKTLETMHDFARAIERAHGIT